MGALVGHASWVIYLSLDRAKCQAGCPTKAIFVTFSTQAERAACEAACPKREKPHETLLPQTPNHVKGAVAMHVCLRTSVCLRQPAAR